jgi:hypothetical protein
MSTYTPIATYTVTGSNLLGTTGVTFSGIPQNYTDLIIVQNTSLTGAAIGLIRVGNASVDTGSNYSQTALSGNGAAASSGRVTNTTVWRTDLAHMTTGWGVYITNIMNYSNTTTNKTCIQRYNNVPYGALEAIVGLWRSTNAINTIQLYLDRAESYLVGSTFTLYGISAGSPKAFGGDEVRTDGTYWYHIYRSSGVFAPVTNLSCDYLVVAGGAGGGRGDTAGNNSGGAGGAGGLRSTVTATGGGGTIESALALTGGSNYTVTVGAGGAAATGVTVRGTNGNNSVFATVTSTGGGGGGSNNFSPWTGATGGSGGGGSSQFTGPYTNGVGGTGTANQGYAGGQGNINAGGGGGGAGAVGSAGNAGTTVGGAGGAGVAISITGSSVTYAGGGGGNGASGGGAGGSGGGGAGSYNGTAGSGTANTGGGGGASSNTSGAGGSGIVIVRYAV